MMSSAIETQQLTRYFGDFCAVDGIDLRVEGGTFYGFLGPNGAGKATTIKMLTGLLAVSRGQVLVLGRNVLDQREALDGKRRVGVIPEDLALFEGADAVTSRIVRDLLAGYVARGSTVFLTSHVLEIVEKLCTHVGIIVKGALVEQDSLEAIRQGSSLEDRFLQRAGADAEATRK